MIKNDVILKNHYPTGSRECAKVPTAGIFLSISRSALEKTFQKIFLKSILKISQAAKKFPS